MRLRDRGRRSTWCDELFTREGAKVVFGDMLDDDGRQVEAEIRFQYLDFSASTDYRSSHLYDTLPPYVIRRLLLETHGAGKRQRTFPYLAIPENTRPSSSYLMKALLSSYDARSWGISIKSE